MPCMILQMISWLATRNVSYTVSQANVPHIGAFSESNRMPRIPSKKIELGVASGYKLTKTRR